MTLEAMAAQLRQRRRGVQAALDVLGLVETTVASIEHMGALVETWRIGPALGLAIGLPGGQFPFRFPDGAPLAPGTVALPGARLWSGEEIGIALEMAGTGTPAAEIAAAMGRPAGALDWLRLVRRDAA